MAMAGAPRMGPRQLHLDETITTQKVRPGTVRRILPYARRYRAALITLLLATVVDAVATAAGPVVLKLIVDNGVVPHRGGVVVGWAGVIAGVALLDALAVYIQAWCSGRVGQGLIYDLRTAVFDHVQRQPLAFFSRAQTGALVSRLNGDVIGAQQAVTSLLSQSASTLLTLSLVVATMLVLSWQLTCLALVMLPFFLVPGRFVGNRLQRLTRQEMQLDAETGSMMNERFNVAGAMLVKLYGRPQAESRLFANRAGRVRDIAVATAVYARIFFILVSLLAGLTTALVYGVGGELAVHGSFQVGTLVAMAALLARMYGPINQLSNMQMNVMAALVSFDRVFEVLDLQPLVAERPDARVLELREREAPPADGDVDVDIDGVPGTAGRPEPAPEIEFENVGFRYPAAREVSLASLESIALKTPERITDALVLRDVSFRAPAGRLTALVGPSGAGKTTISHLVPRLYDVTSGAVRIGGQDVRDVTLQSLHDAIGVVTQDAHMFHDTIRTNLLFARPDATEDDLIEACEAAQIWDLIAELPDRLDTVVGDRGYRLSGGEKQRVALARLLLKSPPVVVLDEATAHLDSESEAAIQRALKTALAGRTSLVIAHRLSTIRDADQILVLDGGLVRERGTHDELLAADGAYAKLHRTQFAGREEDR